MHHRLRASRRRTLQAFADVATSERAALVSAFSQAATLAGVCGAGNDPLMAFHSLPRHPGVVDVDNWEYDEDDHVLVALDIVDVSGRRRRLSAAGLHEASFGQPVTVAGHSAYAPSLHLPPAARTSPEAFSEGTLAELWQFATLTWVDLRRALCQWLGGSVAPALVVLPAGGHALAFPPVTEDEERTPSSVVSIEPAPQVTPVEDLDAALTNILAAEAATSLEQIEQQIILRAELQGLVLPGFPQDAAPGDCNA